MNPAQSVHRSALALLAANLGLGLIPFTLFAAIHPAIRWQGAIPLGICLGLALLISRLVSRDALPAREQPPAPPRRALACLLLGASIAAIPWKQHDWPLAPLVLGLGFCTRWCLFAIETLDLQIADRRHLPLPCAATRIRRGCTMVTGALIPLLLLAGLPCLPLLWISLCLTLFCQWTVGGEFCHPSTHPIPSLRNHEIPS